MELKRDDRLVSSGRKRPHTQRKPVLSHLDEAGEWPISRNRPRQARNEATVIRQARHEATVTRQARHEATVISIGKEDPKGSKNLIRLSWGSKDHGRASKNFAQPQRHDRAEVLSHCGAYQRSSLMWAVQ